MYGLQRKRHPLEVPAEPAGAEMPVQTLGQNSMDLEHTEGKLEPSTGLDVRAGQADGQTPRCMRVRWQQLMS